MHHWQLKKRINHKSQQNFVWFRTSTQQSRKIFFPKRCQIFVVQLNVQPESKEWRACDSWMSLWNSHKLCRKTRKSAFFDVAVRQTVATANMKKKIKKSYRPPFCSHPNVLKTSVFVNETILPKNHIRLKLLHISEIPETKILDRSFPHVVISQILAHTRNTHIQEHCKSQIENRMNRIRCGGP